MDIRSQHEYEPSRGLSPMFYVLTCQIFCKHSRSYCRTLKKRSHDALGCTHEWHDLVPILHFLNRVSIANQDLLVVLVAKRLSQRYFSYARITLSRFVLLAMDTRLRNGMDWLHAKRHIQQYFSYTCDGT